MDIELQALSDQFAANDLKISTVVQLLPAFQRTIAGFSGQVNGMISAGVDPALVDPLNQSLANANTQIQATLDAINSGAPVNAQETANDIPTARMDPAAGRTGPAKIPTDRPSTGPLFNATEGQDSKPTAMSTGVTGEIGILNSTGGTTDVGPGGPAERQATAIGAHPAPGPLSKAPDEGPSPRDKALKEFDGVSDFAGGPHAGSGTAGSVGNIIPGEDHETDVISDDGDTNTGKAERATRPTRKTD